MSKHTLGPWRLSNYHYPHCEIVADRGSSDTDSRPGARLICRTADNGKLPYEFKANARLIAAAPDLLKACKAIIENEPKGITPYFDESIELAEQAIAKATS